jgi:hypothetical protein
MDNLELQRESAELLPDRQALGTFNFGFHPFFRQTSFFHPFFRQTSFFHPFFRPTFFHPFFQSSFSSPCGW